MRTRTMGRSPEIPCRQRPEFPCRFAATADDDARSAWPAKMMCAASRWKRWASAGARLRWRCSTWAWAQATSKARAEAEISAYWSAIVRASSREEAIAVANATTAEPPGAIRTRRRRLRIGSSTAPVAPESTAPGSSAAGSAVDRPRPRKRERSVSSWGSPMAGPSLATTWTAQIGFWSAERGRRRASRAWPPGRASVSTNSLPKAGCARSAPRVSNTTSA